MTDTDKFSIITETVREYKKIPLAMLRKKTQEREIAETRQIIYYFARRMTALGVIRIGVPFFQHHTTVMHGSRVVDNLIAMNGYGPVINLLRKKINHRIKARTRFTAQKNRKSIINRNTAKFNKWILSMGTLIQN